jgi:hypothetical protein
VVEPAYLELDLGLLVPAQVAQALLLLFGREGVPGPAAVLDLVAHDGDLVVGWSCVLAAVASKPIVSSVAWIPL